MKTRRQRPMTTAERVVHAAEDLERATDDAETAREAENLERALQRCGDDLSRLVVTGLWGRIGAAMSDEAMYQRILRQVEHLQAVTRGMYRLLATGRMLREELLHNTAARAEADIVGEEIHLIVHRGQIPMGLGLTEDQR